jgi:hypothetical protein
MASYKYQKKRGLERKKKIVDLHGGCCEVCGYNRNLAVLEFHHIDPLLKSFKLDVRNLTNRKWESVIEESNKCRLLCANCHREEHNPDFEISAPTRI